MKTAQLVKNTNGGGRNDPLLSILAKGQRGKHPSG